MPHYRSLTKDLEKKVLVLVRRYVDEAALAEEQNGTSSGELRLSVTKLYQYIVADGSLPRQKKLNVEKMIEKAIDVLREEAEEDDGDEIDSDFEGLNEMGLMEPTNTNAVNKKIVDMWGTKATATPAVESTASPTSTTPSATQRASSVAPETAAPPVRKRKERSVKDGETTKRVKASSTSTEDRTPPKNITLKDLGGVDDIINDLLELIAMPLTHPEVYAHTGVSPPRGVLLHGPPGCGKTMLANAMAGELGLPFLAVSAPSIVSGMSGESEKKLRELFEEAREKAPCLVFMDEIDAITPKRESAQREMERRIVAQLLTCMDDLTLEKTGGKVVMVIGATNRPDSLDPALRRAGRFDREICLNVPDEVGREKILRVLAQKLRLSGDFDFAALAKMTPGFVGADLNSLTAEAGTSAMKRIFENLKTPITNPGIEALKITPNTPNNTADGMDIDVEPHVPAPLTETLPHEENAPVTSIIQSFLKAYPSTLTPSQLEPLTITLPDFLTALPKIQPSSKREGFATVPDVTWADIGALGPIRVEMQMAIVQPIKRPELYASVGITAPTGVLLWGPPGCGKTLLAKAVANESRANFISVRGPELLNKYVGESERAVRQVFSRARASVPCVIFFDELDALVPRRDDSLSESSARVVNTLLTELDGLNDRKGIYVIGATNRPDVIDPAMLRPGRLDKPLFVDLPTPAERVDILKTITKKCPLEGVELKALGEDARCENFSGADLAALVREASVSALRKSCLKDIGSGSEVVSVPVGQVRVTWEDFETAWCGVRPSVTERQRGEYGKLATKFGWGKEKKKGLEVKKKTGEEL
ncbi:P-loop containing nucleoside triphosphate hydrolase protein [Morchella snyderi]|nr:P-loop containing nucleoside triphosphate hydrolase protein [Morchella snyderi]